VAGREHLVFVWVLVVTLMIATIGMLGLRALPTFEPRGRALLAAGVLLYLAGGWRSTRRGRAGRGTAGMAWTS